MHPKITLGWQDKPSKAPSETVQIVTNRRKTSDQSRPLLLTIAAVHSTGMSILDGFSKHVHGLTPGRVALKVSTVVGVFLEQTSDTSRPDGTRALQPGEHVACNTRPWQSQARSAALEWWMQCDQPLRPRCPPGNAHAKRRRSCATARGEAVEGKDKDVHRLMGVHSCPARV